MNSRLFKLLKETYAGSSRQERWDPELGRTVQDKPGRLSDDDWAWLASGPLPPNAIEAASHDGLVARLRQAARAVDWRDALDGLLLGLSGAWPRGLQTPISLAYASHLSAHAFEPAERARAVCGICGLPPEARYDRTEQVFRLYWGYAWNEQPQHFLVDLEERPLAERPAVRPADIDAARALLEAIDAAPDDEPPSKLEQRLRRAKLPCRVDKYRRYGMLLALGELGVLPNPLIPPSAERFVTWSERSDADRRMGRSHRSDVVLPLGAWRGSLGVDWTRAATLHPDLRRAEGSP